MEERKVEKCINEGQRQGKTVGSIGCSFQVSAVTFRGQELDKFSHPYGTHTLEGPLSNHLTAKVESVGDAGTFIAGNM